MRNRPARLFVSLAQFAFVAVALLAAACGGASRPTVASPAGPPWWEALPPAADWAELDRRCRRFEASPPICDGGSFTADRLAVLDIGDRITEGLAAADGLEAGGAPVPAVAVRVHLHLHYARTLRVAAQRLRASAECSDGSGPAVEVDVAGQGLPLGGGGAGGGGAPGPLAAPYLDHVADGFEQKVLEWLRGLPATLPPAEHDMICRSLPLDPSAVPACAAPPRR